MSRKRRRQLKLTLIGLYSFFLLWLFFGVFLYQFYSELGLQNILFSIGAMIAFTIITLRLYYLQNSFKRKFYGQRNKS